MSRESLESHPKPAIDLLFDEVSQVFWIILFFYIIVSLTWILYCCYIHKMELRLVEKKIEENGMARAHELQRLLDAYNRVTHESSSSQSSDPSSRAAAAAAEQV